MNPLLASLNRWCELRESILRHEAARFHPKPVPTPILCQCNKLVMSGKRCCAQCWERLRKGRAAVRLRQMRKAHGLCVDCGEPAALRETDRGAKVMSRCPQCAKKHTYRTRTAEERKANARARKQPRLFDAA